MRSVTHTVASPTPTPTSAPIAMCCAKRKSSPTPGSIFPSSTSSRLTVRKTAIGSFDPLSSSSVAFTRSGSRSPVERRTENTAAASVEATMPPSSIP